MSIQFDDEELLALPYAHGVGIFYCNKCNQPHVMLFDNAQKPMAHFVVPEGGFLDELIKAVRKS